MEGSFYVHVFDAKGKLVSSRSLTHNEDLDLSNQPVDVYLLRIELNSNYIVKKLIILK